jgi:hypothetical protein
VTVSLADFTPPLSNWRTVTELTLTPAREITEGGRKKTVPGTAWKGSRDFRNLRWEGGEYVAVPTSSNALLTPGEREKAFNAAIKKSLEQEKLDRK